MSELTTRKAPLSTGSYNPATRTFTAVAATSTPVERMDWYEGSKFREVLAIDAKAIRLERFKSGRAPLLDSHRSGTLKDQIGVITAARIERGELHVDVQLSSRPDLEPLAADLAAGVIRNVSVGYRIHATTEEKAADGSRTVTATEWEPFELSLVAIPADQNSFIRSAEGGNHMTTTTDNEPAGSTRAERQRAADLMSIGRRAGMDDAAIDDAIRGETTVAAFRQLALDKLADTADQSRISSTHSSVEFGRNVNDALTTAIEGALFARMTGTAPEGAAREYMGRSLIDMGAELLQARGERVSWRSRERLAAQIMTRSAYHTTSDFPVLLENAGNRVLQKTYNSAPSVLKSLARRRVASDFRPLTVVKMSQAPELEKVNEHGEFKRGTMVDAKEAFKLETYGKIFALTRQAIVNDDLGAFSDVAIAWGRGIAQTEANLLAGLFLANSGNGATLDDGKPLYHADHANKAAAAAALSVESLGAARKAMRLQKDLDGKTIVGLTPKHLVVGPDLETKAEMILAEIAAAQVDHVNPFSNKLMLHVEPRFPGKAWRLFADPAEMETISVAYLGDAEGPYFETRVGFDVDGMEFKARIDFGAAITEHRASYLNTGA